MFSVDVLFAYLAAVVLIVLAPGPDNILAMSRGLSQGPMAAALSSLGAGLGIMAHSTAATLGLALVLHASPVAFLAIKAAGAIYLLGLGIKAIAARRLISFVPADRQPLGRIFLTGLLSNLLNPKPGLFVVTFIPQFVNSSRGSVPAQLLVLGAIFAIVTTIVFTALGPSPPNWHCGCNDDPAWSSDSTLEPASLSLSRAFPSSLCRARRKPTLRRSRGPKSRYRPLVSSASCLLAVGYDGTRALRPWF